MIVAEPPHLNSVGGTIASDPIRPAKASVRPRILCVDDDERVLAVVYRILRTRFDVQVALGGIDALALIERAEVPFAAIISDLHMPGMTGIALLQRARQISPSSSRLLLTGNTDSEVAVEAVNEGAVFRFLTKPFSSESLIAGATAAADQHRLVESERVLLEQTLHGAVKALTEVLAVANPSAFARAMRIKRYVEQIADALEISDRWEIEVAALLSQLGCMSLPSTLTAKMHVGGKLTAEEQGAVDALPAVAARFIAEIPRLGTVCEILLRQNARFDSRAARHPDEIPIGARMLKVATDFDWLLAGGMSMTLALGNLSARTDSYDPQILDALKRALGHGQGPDVSRIRFRDVQEGMVFSADVYGAGGLLLAARGQEVGPALLNRLRYVWNNSLLDTEVSVCGRSEYDDGAQ